MVSSQSLETNDLNDLMIDSRQAQLRVRVRVPRHYQGDPILSNLTQEYGLKVNITAALLSANACEDGWFDLELRGQVTQISNALMYLNDLNLEIWRGSTSDESW